MIQININDIANKVRSAVLTGLNTALTGAVVATDTVLEAFGKIQNQINGINTSLGNKLEAGDNVSSLTNDSGYVDSAGAASAAPIQTVSGTAVDNTDPANPVIDSTGGGGATNHSELVLDDGTNPHGTTKSDVGLGNVDNTSDVNKPVSTAQQTALDLKADQTALDAHTGDATIHFTEGSIDHVNIQNIGVNTHAQIDSHIADAAKHREINDLGATVTDLWSADKIGTELDGKADVGGSDLSLKTAGTGIIFGGQLSINAVDNSTFDVAAGAGYITDHTTTPSTIQLVEWSAFTGVALTNLATSFATDVAINSAGAIIQQDSFTDVELRSLILLGGLDHSNQTNIGNTFELQVPVNGVVNSLAEFAKAVGDINISGNVFMPNGANLNIDKSSGESFKFGSNNSVNVNSPHIISQAAETAATFNYVFDDGTGVGSFMADTTTIDPTIWDNGSGTLQSVTGNNFTIQRILLFANSNSIFVQPGTETFTNINEAIDGIPITKFVNLSGIRTAMVRGYLIVKANATELNNESDAIFIEADKFGGVGSRSSGVAGITNHSELNLDDGTNPHGTTKADVGLSNVDNLQQYPNTNPSGFETPAELDSRDTANRNRANHTGTQLASTISDFDTEVENNAQVSQNTTHRGLINNPHSVTKAQVGLSDVDNTSDADKPVSTAQQAALDLKANDSEVVKLTDAQTVDGVKTFNASPIVPTPTTDFQAATKKYVDDNAGGGGGGIDAITTETSSGPTTTITTTNSAMHVLTMEGDITATISDFNEVAKTHRFILKVVQDATGGRTLTIAGNVLFPSGSQPSNSESAGAFDLYIFDWDGTNWLLDNKTSAYA